MNICAPFAGIVRYHVEAGQEVATGQAIATVEATKLETPVVAPGPGVVERVCTADFADVLGGDVLAVLSVLAAPAQ